MRLTEKEIAEYFHRSYTAVDGLWFMKVEERLGFEAALQIDAEVWKVLPKIQARMLKAAACLDKGMDGLRQAISVRLEIEGFDFETETFDDELRIFVTKCPWHDMMVKSNRKGLSGRVGDLICDLENSVWASELGNFAFERNAKICQGDERCVLCFKQ